jgi:hypothetical protein
MADLEERHSATMTKDYDALELGRRKRPYLSPKNYQ